MDSARTLSLRLNPSLILAAQDNSARSLAGRSASLRPSQHLLALLPRRRQEPHDLRPRLAFRPLQAERSRPAHLAHLAAIARILPLRQAGHAALGHPIPTLKRGKGVRFPFQHAQTMKLGSLLISRTVLSLAPEGQGFQGGS